MSASPATGRIHHRAARAGGIENFDGERVARTLEDAGFEGVRGGGGSVLVPDPDGLVVRLSAVTERFEGTPPDRGC